MLVFAHHKVVLDAISECLQEKVIILLSICVENVHGSR